MHPKRILPRMAVLALGGIACTLALPFAAQADRGASIFDRYPITHEVSLLGGERVPMPFQIYGGKATLLIGTADLSKLKGPMRANGVEPARVSPHKGLVGLYVIHYSDTVIGAYSETFITTLVNYSRPTGSDIFKNYLDVVKVFIPFLNFTVPEQQNLGFFAWKLWVDSDVSMRAGREIWGYNKTLAQMQMHTTRFSTNVTVADSDGLFFRASLQSILIPLLYTFPLSMDFVSTTPREIKQTSGRAIIQADASIRGIVGGDAVKFNRKHPWGKLLRDMHFHPLVWIQAKNPSAIIFDPFKDASALTIAPTVAP